MRILSRALLLGTALLLSCAAPAQDSVDEARALVLRYIELHNSHDLEGVMALYDDDAVFHLSMGRPAVRGAAAIRELERFDVAAGSTIYPERVVIESSQDRWHVHIGAALEHSSVFEAAGVAIVRAQPIRDAFVLRKGHIVEMHQPELRPACSRVVLGALRGLSEWLLKVQYPQHQALVADGFVRLTPETLPAIVAALGDFRSATGWQPASKDVSDCAAFELR